MVRSTISGVFCRGGASDEGFDTGGLLRFSLPDSPRSLRRWAARSTYCLEGFGLSWPSSSTTISSTSPSSSDDVISSSISVPRSSRTVRNFLGTVAGPSSPDGENARRFFELVWRVLPRVGWLIDMWSKDGSLRITVGWSGAAGTKHS